jgi:hypothetical protein
MTLVSIKRSENHLPHLHLSPDQSQAIDFIMEYPFNEVREKLIRKQALPEEKVDQAITEYRKFLVLARLGHGPLEMFSHYVDEVWHTHILFTRDYAKFCQMAFGRFFHHQPHTGNEKGASQDAATQFVSMYTDLFGLFSPLWETAHSSDYSDGYGGGGGSNCYYPLA